MVAINDDGDMKRTNEQTDKHGRMDGRADIEIIMNDHIDDISINGVCI